jgi:ArsR family transcriptional regulator, lead/cadmium/zinc/bismuth-responsive transcriptional repressor
VPSHHHHHAAVAHKGASADHLAAASEVFRAAGDVGRLRLLDRLAAGRQCVTELAETFALPMPTISQQLRVLLQAGLVVRTRDGKHQYYELADDHIIDLVRVALAHAGETH